MRCWQAQTTRVPHPFAYFAKGWEIWKSEARVRSLRAGQESPADVSVRWLNRRERLVAFLGRLRASPRAPARQKRRDRQGPGRLIDGGEGFLVFVVEDEGGIFQIEFVRLRHRVIVGRVFDRGNENRCVPAASCPPIRKERERMGHPANRQKRTFRRPVSPLASGHPGDLDPDLRL